MRFLWISAGVLATALVANAPAPSTDLAADRAAILAIHARMLAWHLEGNHEQLALSSAPDFFSVFNGEIHRDSPEQRRESLRGLFTRLRFTEYVDLVSPHVRVSPDGNLAWLLAQTKATGVRRQDDGAEQPFQYVTAWVTLFEKREGRWVRVGASTSIRP